MSFNKFCIIVLLCSLPASYGIHPYMTCEGCETFVECFFKCPRISYPGINRYENTKDKREANPDSWDLQEEDLSDELSYADPNAQIYEQPAYRYQNTKDKREANQGKEEHVYKLPSGQGSSKHPKKPYADHGYEQPAYRFQKTKYGSGHVKQPAKRSALDGPGQTPIPNPDPPADYYAYDEPAIVKKKGLEAKRQKRESEDVEYVEYNDHDYLPAEHRQSSHSVNLAQNRQSSNPIHVDQPAKRSAPDAPDYPMIHDLSKIPTKIFPPVVYAQYKYDGTGPSPIDKRRFTRETQSNEYYDNDPLSTVTDPKAQRPEYDYTAY